jgi:peptide deformylase
MAKIYVGNLPFSADEAAVRSLFSQHGTVESVALPTDRETGRPRGFGFVEMPQADAARAIQALNGYSMGGRPLRVNEAQDKPRTGGGGGGRPGGRWRRLWPRRWRWWRRWWWRSLVSAVHIERTQRPGSPGLCFLADPRRAARNMTVRNILRMGDPLLLQRAAEVKSFGTPELQELLADMFDTMHAAGGVGLAAPQIGESLRVVVFGFEQSERYPDAPAVPRTILVNPVLTPLGEEQEEVWEGCLSVPGLRGLVPRHLRLRYQGIRSAGRSHRPHRGGVPCPGGAA